MSMSFVIPTRVANTDAEKAVAENIRSVRGHGRDEVLFMRGFPGMAAALNAGTQQAKFSRLCFMHDDLELRPSPYWSDGTLDNFFATRKVGFIGPAGSKDIFPDGRWYVNGNRASGGVIHGQHYKDGTQPKQARRLADGRYYAEWFSRYGDYGRVVVIDGLCMVSSKEALEAIGGFDEETFANCWHFYDLDASIRAHLAGFHNVTLPLFMRHLSLGSYNDQWLHVKRKFVEKWKLFLPVMLEFKEDYIVERLANLQLKQAAFTEA